MIYPVLKETAEYLSTMKSNVEVEKTIVSMTHDDWRVSVKLVYS